MSRKTLIQSIQPDPQGPVYGRVSDPVEFMNSQEYEHEHIEAVTRDMLMATSVNALVAGFDLTINNALDVIISSGHAVKPNGLSYETLPLGDNINVSLDAAHPSLPRIDLVYAVLETEADAEVEFRPYVRLRTQLELEQGIPQYTPQQFNQATEKHNKATVLVKKGTPAANPVAPTTNANEAPLYEIRVETGAVNLTSDKVTDVRDLMTSLFELANIIEELDGTLQPLSEKDQPNGYAGLNSGGKIDVNQIPALKSHEFYVVANQAARLAQNSSQVQLGDETFQTDTGETYKLISADPSQNNSWKIIADTTPDWSVITNKPATFASTIPEVSGLQSALDGKLAILPTLIQMGGATSGFPALKRNNMKLEVRLADDSDVAAVKTGVLNYRANNFSMQGGTIYLTKEDSGLIISGYDGLVILPAFIANLVFTIDCIQNAAFPMTIKFPAGTYIALLNETTGPNSFFKLDSGSTTFISSTDFGNRWLIINKTGNLIYTP